jgi:hypothetical protein
MNTAVQVTVFLMMAVVGLDLTVADFRRIGEQPRIPVLATLGQWLSEKQAAKNGEEAAELLRVAREASYPVVVDLK